MESNNNIKNEKLEIVDHDNCVACLDLKFDTLILVKEKKIQNKINRYYVHSSCFVDDTKK